MSERLQRLLPVASAALVLLAASPPSPLRAEELTLELWSRFRIDAETVVATEDPADDLTQVRPRYTGVGVLSWGPWSLNAVVEVRTTNSPAPGDDRYFEDIGIWAEELYIAYAGEGWQVYAGKFNPRFGQAFDHVPGGVGFTCGDSGPDHAGDGEFVFRALLLGFTVQGQGLQRVTTLQLGAGLFQKLIKCALGAVGQFPDK